ncbi:hypothetical protein OE09_2108 [Flavobacteriaceae bacterium MAR_2010_72]|nr:hypothetical protein OE09_2108 [Flavobacteriaceae bacterium MAR_2010_72]
MERWLQGFVLYCEIRFMTKTIVYFILIIGIILRLIFQFVNPAFNIDEIALGDNIKKLSFIDLLYPLDHYQSAPPLYLWLQKILVVTLPFSFWIKIKLLNLLASIIGLYLFFRLLTKVSKYQIVAVLALGIFAFNPFIIYNALNVKQYGFDLLGVLTLLNLYHLPRFKTYNWVFFAFWCLMSNIGLFGCAGYLLFMFIKNQTRFTFHDLLGFVKHHFKTFLSPMPYILYFLWYLRQEGASELKTFMYAFWSDNFIPLNVDIFEYSLYFCHEIWMFFFSAFEFWGIFLTLLLIPLLIKVIKRQPFLFKNEMLLLLCVFFFHIILNILGQYPLSDRSILYLAPLFILMLASSLDNILSSLSLNKNAITYTLTAITIGLYCFYLPFKNNNVVALYKKLNLLDENKIVYLTPKAHEYITRFNDFTDHEFKCKCSFTVMENGLSNENYLVSKIHTKINPNAIPKEELKVQQLIDEQKIIPIGNVSGYNLFKILDVPVNDTNLK